MNNDQTINGKVTRIGYYRDTLPKLVIAIKKNGVYSLHALYGTRQPIRFSLFGETYLAGIRTTPKSAYINICPDLQDSNGNPLRLADLLLGNNIQSGSSVSLCADREAGLVLLQEC